LINLYVPIYNKKIVDSVAIVPVEFRYITFYALLLTYKNIISIITISCRWDIVLIYVTFKFLQGGGTGSMGLLNNLRSFLWIRIQQYTTREVELELFR